MTRVCVLLRSLAPGGAEKQALLLVQALAGEHAAQLVVLSVEPRAPRHLAFLAEHGLRTTFLPANAAHKALALRRHLRRERIEALFCFLPSDTVLGALVARSAGVPRVYGGLRNARLARRKELALRFVHNHVSHATISNSHAAAEHFAARGFDRAKMLVIPNGIALRPPLPERPASPTVTVLTACRFVAEKDVRTALQAVRLAADACRNECGLRYVLAGSGPLEGEILRWAEELGLASALELQRDPADVLALFEQADVYLSTSRFEGLSNSILEAMNAGLPIVATDVGDNARLVQPERNGFLAPVGDPATLSEHLSKLVRSRAARLRHGAASRAILEEGYSFEAFRSAYARLL
jgi:glycosyltransferase involved in cell wall biosynthesis